jgi:glycosyltransferase involved in cell wall biosynthesis
MSKVLFVRPDASRLGGIEAYFDKLSPHLRIDCESFGIARRAGERGAAARALRLLSDYRRYWARLADPAIGLVHINASLERNSFYREALFLRLARLRGKRSVVFFHGWRPDFERRVDRGGGRQFRLLFGGADAYVVLAASFAAALRRWGVRRDIHSEVMVIEDEAALGFDLERALQRRQAAPRVRLLFASRLLRSKGIGTTLQALAILQHTHPQFELLVAGDGEAAGEARALAQRLRLANVEFLGVVSGARKYELYRDAHLLCFPTEHGEGFPNVIAEAMAFGLPVVTRPVGGIPDFFRDGVHGYLTGSTAPADVAALVLRIAGDPQGYRRMAEASHAYARAHLLTSQAARRLERLCASLAGAPARAPSVNAAPRRTR